MPIHKFYAAVLASVLCLAIVVPAVAEWQNPKANIPPLAKPQRRSAAEGMPPLPLPATPLRRSERKREPAPPALVGMINFGTQVQMVNGQRRNTAAFPTTQIDIERLMQYANEKLNIRYRYVPTTLNSFSWDPTELPVLYITGWTALPMMSDEMLGKLRRYLLDGGTIVMHAQCGREEFVNSARPLIARLLPGRELAPMDTDSPLFHAYFNIGGMRVRKDSQPFKRMTPYIEAVYVGCRPALIFSPIDLNCGWDVDAHPIEGGILYHQDDATALGVNILASTLVNQQYARAWGTEKIFHQQQDKSRDQLVIAQVVHSGDWDPTPHGLPGLMKYVQGHTTLNVQFKREVVDLGDVDMFKHPVLYMTGLREFKFTAAQITQLRNYLKSGGVLVADAASGNKAFDVAFRREIKSALPGLDFKLLPSDCPVYQMPFPIKRVEYSDIVKNQEPALNTPALEGITIDGQLAVIYSPFSLSNGWEQLKFPYNRGYSDDDALRLGVNIFSYALTH